MPATRFVDPSLNIKNDAYHRGSTCRCGIPYTLFLAQCLMLIPYKCRKPCAIQESSSSFNKLKCCCTVWRRQGAQFTGHPFFHVRLLPLCYSQSRVSASKSVSERFASLGRLWPYTTKRIPYTSLQPCGLLPKLIDIRPTTTNGPWRPCLTSSVDA